MKYRKFKQNKLWRDKAVDLMENMGSKIHWHKLNDIEFVSELKVKFIEESQEVYNAKSKQELMEELADVLEVIDAFASVYNFSFKDIVEIKNRKHQKRGGFLERKFVSIAEHLEDSFGEKYCLADPGKYPEVID